MYYNDSTLQVYPQISFMRRWLMVVPLAALTTFGLMVLMYKLVFTEAVAVDDTPYPTIDDVTWKKPDPPVSHIKKPEPPEKVIETPVVPDPTFDEVDPSDIVMPTQEYTLPGNDGIGVFDPSMPIAQFLVSPNYPGRALNKGIEGFVELRFDVNKMGATENIVVTRAEPQGYFEKAAISAAERWKYQPKTQGGKAVDYKGMSHRVTFEIQG